MSAPPRAAATSPEWQPQPTETSAVSFSDSAPRPSDSHSSSKCSCHVAQSVQFIKPKVHIKFSGCSNRLALGCRLVTLNSEDVHHMHYLSCCKEGALMCCVGGGNWSTRPPFKSTGLHSSAQQPSHPFPTDNPSACGCRALHARDASPNTSFGEVHGLADMSHRTILEGGVTQLTISKS
eukprot:490292-Amphidinium_carterae.3